MGRPVGEVDSRWRMHVHGAPGAPRVTPARLESDPDKRVREQRRDEASLWHRAQVQLAQQAFLMYCGVQYGREHDTVPLICTRLSMETRRALATMRHLIRQAPSHVLWHVCGTEAHQDRPTASVKDEMELGNIQDGRRFTTLSRQSCSSELVVAHRADFPLHGHGSHRMPGIAHYG